MNFQDKENVKWYIEEREKQGKHTHIDLTHFMFGDKGCKKNYNRAVRRNKKAFIEESLNGQVISDNQTQFLN